MRELIQANSHDTVFAAHDRMLGREVALKVATSEAGIENLRREGRMLAPLCHPSVPSVYGYGQHDGADDLGLERVRGMSLGAYRDLRAARGGFAISEVASIVAGIADALAVLHANGYVHGNLTAESVVIASDGRIVVRDPIIVGDVVPGESGDTRTDIHALGYIAHALASGQPWALGSRQ